MFVIKWKENYYNATKTHWGDLEKAQKFQTADKAFTFSLHACSKEWEIDEISIIDLKTKEKVIAAEAENPIITMTAEEAEKTYTELLVAVEQLGKIAEKIPSLKAYYANVHAEQDKMQEDILHKMEFSSGNIMFVKLGRMLKNCRLERREAKNRLSYLGNISSAIPTKLLKQHTASLEGLANRKYTPRILTELFDK